MSLLSPDEDRVMQLLGDAAGAFADLPVVHPSDADEFVHAIHAAQNIVLARPAFRESEHYEHLVKRRVVRPA